MLQSHRLSSHFDLPRSTQLLAAAMMNPAAMDPKRARSAHSFWSWWRLVASIPTADAGGNPREPGG